MGIEWIVIMLIVGMIKNGVTDGVVAARGGTPPSVEKFRAREARRDKPDTSKADKEPGAVRRYLTALKDHAATEAVEKARHNHQRRLAWYGETAKDRDDAWRARQQAKIARRKEATDRFAAREHVIECGGSSTAPEPGSATAGGPEASGTPTATVPTPDAAKDTTPAPGTSVPATSATPTPPSSTPVPSDAKPAASTGPAAAPTASTTPCQVHGYDWTPTTSRSAHEDFGHWKCRNCGHTMTSAEMKAALGKVREPVDVIPASRPTEPAAPVSPSPSLVDDRKERPAADRYNADTCHRPGCDNVRNGLSRLCKECEQERAAGPNPAPAAATTTGGTSVYEQGAAKLAAAADEIDVYRRNLAAFRSAMDGRKWGAGVTGPIGEMDVELAAAAAAYRGLAEQILAEGNKVKDAYDQHPDVPKDAALV